jgi:hypothetical protein
MLGAAPPPAASAAPTPAAAAAAAVRPSPRPGAFSLARQLLAAEGVAGLYSGFGAVLIGVLPANAAYFGGFEAGKALVPPSWGTSGDMVVGAIAQLVAGVVYTPVDMVKERLQVGGAGQGACRPAPGRAWVGTQEWRGCGGCPA